ncbi:NTP pyrophosphohydrolase-like protein [Seal parapoxvirus]|uniref:NTP pyrophosphohydrolase-like protein n=1 Tax=Seal parapoxvirus TaxID=187984 RepID=A0A1Z3GCT4_9POXV|nr:NTP pyrophosphohydrolase-like protein [Seal parapoxvirus]ASC55569.1 NTP pyrophosphohydrolase-like protein [Seal parapoxvirus]
MRNYASLFSKLVKSNRRLGSTRVFRDPLQHISATAFVFQRVDQPRRISICAVLTTTDGLVVACCRRHSFLSSELAETKSPARRVLLETKHANALARSGAVRPRDDVMFPGGAPLRGEGLLECVVREVEEETGIGRNHVRIDNRMFVHAFIDDLVTGRDFDAIIFTGTVRLSSAEVERQFLPNREVKGLVFLRAVDDSAAGVMARLAAFALAAAMLRCWGSAALTR